MVSFRQTEIKICQVIFAFINGQHSVYIATGGKRALMRDIVLRTKAIGKWVYRGTSMRDIVLRRIAMQITRIRFARYPTNPFCA